MSQIDIIDELKGIAQYLGDNDMTTCLRVVNRAIKEIQDGRDYTVEEVNRIKAELQKTLNAGAVWEGAYREAERGERETAGGTGVVESVACSQPETNAA